MELTDFQSNYDMLSQAEINTPNPNTPMVQTAPASIEPTAKKRGRPKKSETTEVVENTTNLMASNASYISTYEENMDQLKVIVNQADIVAAQLKGMMDTIVSSKTMKNKFFNASNCGSAINSCLSTKLQAIKEMNKTIYDSHQLEAKRAQAVKAAEQAASADDKYIQDLYTAFVNTPINQQMAVPTPFNVQATNVIANSSYAPINTPADGQEGYQNFTQNLTPEQNRMILGDNPNIETVVIYNEYTGETRFDVIDTTTGMRVPNFPLPDPCMLDGIKINKITGIASNTNFNESWKLIIEGSPIPNNF